MIIIFDFEVFKYNTLLGTLLVHDDNTIELKQMWDLDEIRQFYKEHLNDIWIGHNNDDYDNHILEAILHNIDPFIKSKSLINSQFRSKANLQIYTYDLMCCRFYSLKMTELLIGKAIHTTEVDFNLDRPLTENEIALTNSYNKSDLEQTYHNFLELKDPMLLRLRLLKEFNIDKKYLTATEARLASIALGAKQIPDIENKLVKPRIYETLQVKNQDVLNFYLNEDFRKNKKLTVTLCDVEHQMGSGGIHAARKKCHEKDMLYLDVSGYYNLVMINYDLLPRTIPDKGKNLYEYMYHQQLALKGVDNDKRWVYKTILLAVFGASMNKYTDFYDPQIGSLITITGQMFLVDLLEKLEGKIKLIQSNTDGIIVKPLQTSSKEEVLAIVKEWCDRTGFVIKPKEISEIWQRDVNCYCYIMPDGSTDTKGDAFIGSWAIDEPVKNEFYTSKEPAIIAKAILSYLIDKTPVEETVYKYKNKPLYFQYLCKKLSYKYCTLETLDLATNNVVIENIADLNRAFAKKYDGTISMIYKHKDRNGKDSKTKIANIPDNIFIDNGEILSNEGVQRVVNKIDYDWYINRAKTRLTEFFDTNQIKDFLI